MNTKESLDFLKPNVFSVQHDVSDRVNKPSRNETQTSHLRDVNVAYEKGTKYSKYRKERAQGKYRQNKNKKISNYGGQRMFGDPDPNKHRKIYDRYHNSENSKSKSKVKGNPKPKSFLTRYHGLQASNYFLLHLLHPSSTSPPA
jgi:hypothetical protein